MADLFSDYKLGAAWDEMIAADGSPRASYQALYESILRSGTQELRAGVDSLARAYLNQGVTFDVGGEERPFPLDIVPRVIDDASWQKIDKGVRQRVKALEAFLADVYSGHCSAVADGDEAFESIARARPLLTVLDMRRGDDDDLLFLGLLRKRHPQLGAIILLPGKCMVVLGRTEHVLQNDTPHLPSMEQLRHAIDWIATQTHLTTWKPPQGLA